MSGNSGDRSHEDEDELSPGEIAQIADEVQRGTVDPGDARAMLASFCTIVESGRPLPHHMIAYLRVAFRSCLISGKNIEIALGLKRRGGRPGANVSREQMALTVLLHRLAGKSHQDALSEAAADTGWGITIIGGAWRKHKDEALASLRLTRLVHGEAWTTDEIARLTEIYQ